MILLENETKFTHIVMNMRLLLCKLHVYAHATPIATAYAWDPEHIPLVISPSQTIPPPFLSASLYFSKRGAY